MALVESTHDEWLQEQGFGEQGTAVSLKREISGRLLERMQQRGIDAHCLSERMQTSRADVDRLLDPDFDIVSLRALYRAASALGCRLRIELSP